MKPKYKGSFDFIRVNLEIELPIHRTNDKPYLAVVDISSRSDKFGDGELSYSSTAWTTSSYLYYDLDADITIAGYLSIENHIRKIRELKLCSKQKSFLS